MPLILTGLGIYSTKYTDSNGNEQTLRIRNGQDAESLDLPSEVLERLKVVSRVVGNRSIPHFTHTDEIDTPVAEEAIQPEEVDEAPKATISSASLTEAILEGRKQAGWVKEEQPEEPKVEELPEVEEEPKEAPKATPKKKTPAKKKTSAKKKASPAKKKATPKPVSED